MTVLATDTGNVQLQLTGNAFLVVDDPLRFLSIDFNSGDLNIDKLNQQLSNS